VDHDRFAVAIGALRERTQLLNPGDVRVLVEAVRDFCHEVRDSGQPLEVVRAIVELHLGRPFWPADARARALAAVDECFSEHRD
jgi:hypothetical protein